MTVARGALKQGRLALIEEGERNGLVEGARCPVRVAAVLGSALVTMVAEMAGSLI